MTGNFILAIDQGTTGTTALLLDENMDEERHRRVVHKMIAELPAIPE